MPTRIVPSAAYWDESVANSTRRDHPRHTTAGKQPVAAGPLVDRLLKLDDRIRHPTQGTADDCFGDLPMAAAGPGGRRGGRADFLGHARPGAVGPPFAATRCVVLGGQARPHAQRRSLLRGWSSHQRRRWSSDPVCPGSSHTGERQQRPYRDCSAWRAAVPDRNRRRLRGRLRESRSPSSLPPAGAAFAYARVAHQWAVRAPGFRIKQASACFREGEAGKGWRGRTGAMSRGRDASLPRAITGRS